MNEHTGQDYHGRIDLNQRNNSHTQCFLFLEEHRVAHRPAAPRVLEIGCNTGYFSALLKSRGYFVHGVECFSDTAARKGCTDAFFHGTVEDFLDTGAAREAGSFDAVLLGDVLEYLVDPERVLRGLAQCLKPDGVFIISMPNVSHIGVRRMLEDGRWQYRKRGILDSSPLRFYTRHSMRTLLIRVGFGIERSFHASAPIHDIFAPGDAPDTNACNERDHTLQIVFRASRAALETSAFTVPPKHIALLTRNPLLPCFKLRLARPLQWYCDAVGGTLHIGPCTTEDLLRTDVLVLQREPTPAMLQTVREAREMGISIVYDMDDLLTALPDFLVFPFADPSAPEIIRSLASSADRTTCSTARLEAEVAKDTDATALVPNCMAPPRAVAVEEAQADGPCTFVLAASDTVQSAWLRYPLTRILRAYPETKLVIVGRVGQEWQEKNFPADYFPLLSPETFTELLLSLRNAIGIIPLDGSLFSSCKSAIKFYHYSFCGLVTAASNTPPYADEMVHNETGLLLENHSQTWFTALEELIRSVDKRRLLLSGALRWCHEHAGPERAVEAWKRAFHLLPRPDRRTQEHRDAAHGAGMNGNSARP